MAPLGPLVRKAIADSRLHALENHVGQRLPPDDHERRAHRKRDSMKGLKIRVPVSPISISMFSGLGAAPASLQFSEVYTALQTKVVDAQENPLPIIQVASLRGAILLRPTNHIWDGYWFIANGRQWAGCRQTSRRSSRGRSTRPA